MAVRNVRSDFERCRYNKDSVIDLYDGLFANSLNAYKAFFDKTYNGITLNFDIAKDKVRPETLAQFVNLWNQITAKMQLFMDIVKKEKFKASLFGKMSGTAGTLENNFNRLQTICEELDELDTQMWQLNNLISNDLTKVMYNL